ncbi:uncharacterized protein [Ptychodera flava]|uniref:uncharacterized protein isoform X2 n=1 Tax=Ptychodera flava TaxID=63121 RepID=UPI00396A82AA
MTTANRTNGTDAMPVAEELALRDEEARHLAVSMQSPLRSGQTSKRAISRLLPTTERFVFPRNATESHSYTITPELFENGTKAHFSFENQSSSYANNSTFPFSTQVSMTTRAIGCCPLDNSTSANSTGIEQSNSDDALGPVIGGLCTAVGLLLCLWLICFAIEKRIHSSHFCVSRKRAVERHYLPQSRSYPIQVAEMRKALRNWDTTSGRSARRNYPWSSKRSSRQNSISEPNCIVAGRHFGGINTPSITVTSATPEPPSVHPEGEVKIEPTTNGYPGAPTIRVCHSAPTINTASFRRSNSQLSSDADDDNASATTSGDASEESGDNAECKPTRMFLTVGDPYTYTPGGVLVDEAIAETPLRDEAEKDRHIIGDKIGDGANENDDTNQTPKDALLYLSPEMAGLTNQLEIDETHCLKR